MWLALVSLLGTAHAGFHDDLAAMNARGANVALACGSARRMVRGVDTVFQAVAPSDTDGAMWIRMRGFLSGDPGSGAFADDGAFAFGILPGSRPALLLHTTLDAGTVAARLAAVDKGPAPVASGDGFEIQSGTIAMHVSARPERVWVEEGTGSTPVPASAGPDELVDALPDLGPGCEGVVSTDDPKVGHVRAGVYLPLDSAEAGRFAVQSAQLSSAAVLAALSPDGPTLPPDVHSPNAPIGWMTIGISTAKADLKTFLKGKELARGRRLQRLLPIDAGITLGVFEEPGATATTAPEFAVVLPLAHPWPARKALHHVQRLFTLLKAKVQRLPNGFTATVGTPPNATTVVVGARTGELVLASNGPLANAIVAGEGQAWLTPADRERAGGWLLAMQLNSGPAGMGFSLSQPLWLGLKVQGDLVVGEAVVPIGPDGWTTLLKMAEAQKNKAAAKP